MRRVAAQKQAMVRRPHKPFPVQQPVPPIGGFPKINKTAFLRGMARSAGLLKGDPGPSVKLKAPKGKKRRTHGPGIGRLANSAAPGNQVRGGALARGRMLGAAK